MNTEENKNKAIMIVCQLDNLNFNKYNHNSITSKTYKSNKEIIHNCYNNITSNNYNLNQLVMIMLQLEDKVKL